jgi:hypothetical protein
LTDETPIISDKHICQKLRILTTTCLGVLHEDLAFRKSYLSWVPHSMTENHALCPVAFPEELLQVVRQAKETSLEHIY